MIDLATVFAISRAERRLTRRLARYWVFMVLAVLIGIISYVYYTVLHTFFSSWSATVASINPRYILAGFGLYYQFIFIFGIVFLAFDVRARDTRERMVEVLDTLPCSNLELILGKFLGLLIPAWIPVIVVGGILATIGVFTGTAIEPWSLVGFIAVMAVPAFSWIIALSYLVTLLVRHRGLAAVALIALVLGVWTLTFLTPLHTMALFDIGGMYQLDFPSDLTPTIATLGGWSQRIAVMIQALGLLWLAAAVHPRPDDGSRAMRAAVGAGLFIFGVAIIGVFVLQARGWVADQERWAEAHRSVSEQPSPDVVRIEGLIDVEPGKRLSQQLVMEVRAPASGPLDELLFSLNPGLEIERIELDGSPAEFTYEDGLIRIDPGGSLEPGRSVRLELDAAGRLHDWFAYLDGVINPLETNAWNGQVFLLGFKPLEFERRFVALMPGARWLPASGAEIGRGDPNVRPRDLYYADLTVELPEGWLAAGPAKRVEVGSGDGRTSFRFTTTAPVPDVALIAAPFVSRSTTIEGVELEVLIHPTHQKTVDFFADAADELKTWLGERMAEAASIGLAYPYDALTLVEVPIDLRGFAGGWRLDSALTQPAMILMKESTFPTANFERPFKDESTYADREGGVPRGKRDVVLRFFENDFNGGNPFIGAARNYFTNVTAASGEEGLPLDFVFEDLSARLIADRRGFFSAHLFNNQDINAVVGQSIQRFFIGAGNDISVAEAVIETVTSQADVWDAVLGVSLERLDPWEEPKRALNVLTLKGGEMAHSMIDDLGAEASGKLLSTLREGHDEQPITRERVLEAGRQAELDLEPWLALWIEQTGLPGFVAGEAEAYRLEDGEDGSPRYQLLVTVRNDEDAPGLARIEYRAGQRQRGGNRGGGGGSANRPRGGLEHSEPFRVDSTSAVRVGMVMSKPPSVARIAPYLSLNRESFAVDLPEIDEEKIVDREPIVGIESTAWLPPSGNAILVDDLDEGFSVEGEPQRSFLQLIRSTEVEQTDQGLPVMQPGQRPGSWARRTASSAFGRYRHTMAWIRSGKGTQHAVFSAEIPTGGRYRLELHMPSRLTGRGGGGGGRRSRVGTYNLELVMQGDTEPLTFDASSGESGWNHVGEYELPADEVRVRFSDETDGRFVFADAIRWVPVGRPEMARNDAR